MSSLAPGAETDGTRTRKLHAKLCGNHPLPRQSLAIKAPFHCYSTDVRSRNTEASKRSELEDNSDGYVPLVSTRDQCKWTNCEEGMQLSTSAHSKTRANTFPLRAACPSGWISVRRTGTGARDGELMIDESGCGGYGFHTFCCPSGAVVPKCGNYTLVICTRRRQLTKGFQAVIPTTTGNATQLALRV
jgi:hypothetical protein